MFLISVYLFVSQVQTPTTEEPFTFTVVNLFDEWINPMLLSYLDKMVPPPKKTKPIKK